MYSKNIRILLIDDDADFRNAIQTVLRNHGYVCFESSSAHEGFLMIPDVVPDLIIMDVMMEDISSGFRLSKQVRELEKLNRIPHVPILMLTNIQKQTLLNFKGRVGSPYLPVDEFLDKPVDPKVLVKRVEKIIHRKSNLKKERKIRGSSHERKNDSYH